LFYRGIGWFAKWAGVSDKELLANVLALFETQDFDRPSADERGADVSLMALDRDRVWWSDLEADLCDGNRVYVELVNDLARISRGTITVTDVTERWAGEEGPITVEFTANGLRQTVQPEYKDDWITAEVFLAFKSLLNPTPYRLYTWDTQGQDYFCVVLRDEESRLIRKKRGVHLKPGP